MRMPASIEAEARAAVGWFDEHLHHHQTPAATAAAATPTEEHTMQASAILDDLKNGATSVDNWLHTMLGQHVPALIAEVERFQANPIVQELEALGETMLPPGDVALITQIIRMAGKLAGAVPQPQQPDVTQLPPGQTAPEQPAPASTSSDPRSR